MSNTELALPLINWLADTSPEIKDILEDAAERIDWRLSRTRERSIEMIIACLAQGICNAADIADEVNLSFAHTHFLLRELKRQGRVDCRKVPREGSGRPLKAYFLLSDCQS